MAAKIKEQHIDWDAGLHVVTLVDDLGRTRVLTYHILVPEKSCPTCGRSHGGGVKEIDSLVEDVAAEARSMDLQVDALRAHAKAHNLTLREKKP